MMIPLPRLNRFLRRRSRCFRNGKGGKRPEIDMETCAPGGAVPFRCEFGKRWLCSLEEDARKRDHHVSTGSICSRTSVHDREHALLGVMGQYHETHSWLAVPTLLLGLRRRDHLRQFILGTNARQRRRGTTRISQ